MSKTFLPQFGLQTPLNNLQPLHTSTRQQSLEQVRQQTLESTQQLNSGLQQAFHEEISSVLPGVSIENIDDAPTNTNLQSKRLLSLRTWRHCENVCYNSILVLSTIRRNSRLRGNFICCGSSPSRWRSNCSVYSENSYHCHFWKYLRYWSRRSARSWSLWDSSHNSERNSGDSSWQLGGSCWHIPWPAAICITVGRSRCIMHQELSPDSSRCTGSK